MSSIVTYSLSYRTERTRQQKYNTIIIYCKENLTESLARTAIYSGWDSIDGIETWTGWTVRESNPIEGGAIFSVPSRAVPRPTQGTKGIESFPGVKRDASHLPTSTAAVVSGLELHLRLLSVPV